MAKKITSEYEPSEEVNARSAEADTAINNLKNYGNYTSNYENKINPLIDQYANRKPFTYDMNNDMLYQQYKDQYIQQGKQAMADTMGQAAALTGGYGSSYATTAGQQAYNQHLTELNNIIPQLYEMAYNRYQDEGNQLLNTINLYGTQDDREYGRWGDKYNNLYNIASMLDNRANNERSFDYGKFSDDRNFNEGVRQYDLSLANSGAQSGDEDISNILKGAKAIWDSYGNIDGDWSGHTAIIKKQKRDQELSKYLQNVANSGYSEDAIRQVIYSLGLSDDWVLKMAEK